MKTSVSLSLFQGSRQAPILFRDNIEHTIPHIRELGYEGVDLFVLDEKDEKAKQAAKLLQSNGLGVGVVMPAAMVGLGLFLGDPSEDVRNKIVDRLIPFIEFSASIGGMVSLGLVRGNKADEESMDEFEKRFTGSIEKLLPTAEKSGTSLLIEPINRYEINTMNSSLESLSYIKRSDLPLGLLLDTFHMNIEDQDIEDSFIQCREYLKHVHFLDSNRLAPGMGHLDMKGIYGTLKKIGYTGYLCLEALDTLGSEICARKGREFFQSIGL